MLGVGVYMCAYNKVLCWVWVCTCVLTGAVLGSGCVPTVPHTEVN